VAYPWSSKNDSSLARTLSDDDDDALLAQASVRGGCICRVASSNIQRVIDGLVEMIR
jgi:hypothetical protein